MSSSSFADAALGKKVTIAQPGSWRRVRHWGPKALVVVSTSAAAKILGIVRNLGLGSLAAMKMLFVAIFGIPVVEGFHAAVVSPPGIRARRRLFAGFLVSEVGEPVKEELTNENLVKIVREECTDDEVNALVWKCLGYRKTETSYENRDVFPKWRDKYPTPPDLVGVSRIYEKQVDEPVLRANQALVASIPMQYKAGIKEHLSKVGFTGFLMEGLTPNKTRRAQCTNWLLYYREALFGMSLDDLMKQKQRDVAAENQRLRDAGQSLKVASGSSPDK